MNIILTTVKKELTSYFFSPVAYVIAVLFYLYRGLEVNSMVRTAVAYYVDKETFATQYIFQQSTYLMVILVPAILTMRCFAEEKRSGSLEVLLTAPVRDVEVALGKWMAAVVFFAVLWLPTLFLLWLLSGSMFLDQELVFGPILSGYLGMFLLGSLLLSVGVFTSSLTDNQLLASLCAIIFNYALLQAPVLLNDLLGGGVDQAYLLQVFLRQINVNDHLSSWFGRGLINSSHLLFYIGGTMTFLFFTVKSLESRRWR